MNFQTIFSAARSQVSRRLTTNPLREIRGCFHNRKCKLRNSRFLLKFWYFPFFFVFKLFSFHGYINRLTDTNISQFYTENLLNDAKNKENMKSRTKNVFFKQTYRIFIGYTDTLTFFVRRWGNKLVVVLTVGRSIAVFLVRMRIIHSAGNLTVLTGSTISLFHFSYSLLQFLIFITLFLLLVILKCLSAKIALQIEFSFIYICRPEL